MILTALIIILLSLFSCKPSQTITEREYYDTTIIREVTKIVEIPGETIRTPSVNLDSLVAVIKSGVKPEIVNRTLSYTDPETKASIGLLLDEMGNISALCETYKKQIQYLEREVERVQTERVEETVIKDVTFWKQIRLLVIGFLIGVVVTILLRVLKVI